MQTQTKLYINYGKVPCLICYRSVTEVLYTCLFKVCNKKENKYLKLKKSVYRH